MFLPDFSIFCLLNMQLAQHHEGAYPSGYVLLFHHHFLVITRLYKSLSRKLPKIQNLESRRRVNILIFDRRLFPTKFGDAWSSVLKLDKFHTSFQSQNRRSDGSGYDICTNYSHYLIMESTLCSSNTLDTHFNSLQCHRENCKT